MTNYSRPMSPVAAAICIVAMIGAATPAAAVEDSAPIGAAAKTSPAKSSAVCASPSVTKRHVSHRTRLAISRYNHRVSLVGNGPECSGVWCGRQFVLMIGIGF
jgi:hypothetical protein